MIYGLTASFAEKIMIDLLIEALIPNVRMFLVSSAARDRT